MSPWTGEAAALAARVAAWIGAAAHDLDAPEPLDGLFLDVHDFQRRHDPVVAALTESPPRGVADIPAVPVGLFKDLPVGTVREGEPHVAFRTSGTTGGGRGVHRLRSTALYDRGALPWARRCVGRIPPDVLALLEDPARVPDSSLSHMVGDFAARLTDGRATWHLSDGRLDAEGLNARVRAASGPVFVAATAFALAEWLEGTPPPLPDGSVVMVTGGFKGRVTRLEDDELYALARERLRPTQIVTEYGMTELSSQLWGRPGAPYEAPPWMRVVPVDPFTGVPVPVGQRGQLRFYDLCNLDSSVGIETMDEGTLDERGRLTLHGRLPGAPLRGCSLTVEEAWAKRSV